MPAPATPCITCHRPFRGQPWQRFCGGRCLAAFAMREAMTTPTPVTCGRCGGLAAILPTGDARGVCVCPVCSRQTTEAA